MSGVKGRSGGKREGAGRPFSNVWTVLQEQVEQGQCLLLAQFPDEAEPIPFDQLRYNHEIGLYDRRRFPNLEEKEAKVVQIIKASHSGPVWVEIGPGRNPVDLKNHMHLSAEQEAAYQQALLLVKQGDYDGAVEVLKPEFEKVWIETIDG